MDLNSETASAQMAEYDAAEGRLRVILEECGPALVAYSGGVDSAYLAWMAYQVQGARMLAVIADSPSLPRRHLREALAFAARHAIPCEVVTTSEMANPDYARNDRNRCFFCKDALFARMEQAAAERPGLGCLMYGVNADDTLDFRPGHRAATEHGVRAPLLEAELGKSAVRSLAQRAGLEVWDRPASACLSSRVAYGLSVTPEVLARIEAGEEALYRLGFRQFRVRFHQDIVRLEIARDELPQALTLEMAGELTRCFKALGFQYVTLDLEGFRSGAMNEGLLPLHRLMAEEVPGRNG